MHSFLTIFSQVCFCASAIFFFYVLYIILRVSMIMYSNGTLGVFHPGLFDDREPTGTHTTSSAVLAEGDSRVYIGEYSYDKNVNDISVVEEMENEDSEDDDNEEENDKKSRQNKPKFVNDTEYEHHMNELYKRRKN